MTERDLELAGALGIDVEPGRFDGAPFEIGRQRRNARVVEHALHELAMGVGDHRLEVLDRGLFAAALADVLDRHREVDTVGTSLDVLVDPIEFDLEAFGFVGERAQDPEASGVGDRGDDVAAMTEREDRELDVESFTNRCLHWLLPC